MEVYTKAAYPSEWATTQNNLGIAWQDLPCADADEQTANLRVAIAYYLRALEVFTKVDFPHDWAMTQNNIGNAWGDLPTGNRAENLRSAVDYYTGALQVYTKATVPVDWARTQTNLGIAWADLADEANLPVGQDRCGLLRRAIACSKGALTVRTLDAFPLDHARTSKNMNTDRRAYEAAGCADQLPFVDILPAE